MIYLLVVLSLLVISGILYAWRAQIGIFSPSVEGETPGGGQEGGETLPETPGPNGKAVNEKDKEEGMPVVGYILIGVLGGTALVVLVVGAVLLNRKKRGKAQIPIKNVSQKGSPTGPGPASSGLSHQIDNIVTGMITGFSQRDDIDNAREERKGEETGELQEDEEGEEQREEGQTEVERLLDERKTEQRSARALLLQEAIAEAERIASGHSRIGRLQPETRPSKRTRSSSWGGQSDSAMRDLLQSALSIYRNLYQSHKRELLPQHGHTLYYMEDGPRKVMVRDAEASLGMVDDLYKLLKTHLPEVEERRRSDLEVAELSDTSKRHLLELLKGFLQNLDFRNNSAVFGRYGTNDELPSAPTYFTMYMHHLREMESLGMLDEATMVNGLEAFRRFCEDVANGRVEDRNKAVSWFRLKYHLDEAYGHDRPLVRVPESGTI